MIVWDANTMSTGISMIDAQHKMLFEKFNEFSATFSISPEAASREAAGELLDFLQFYANWHFGREENCMNQYKCPAAADNKKAHTEFLKTFSQFYEEWQTGNMTPKLINETYLSLESWLVNHVARVDTQLRSCVVKS